MSLKPNKKLTPNRKIFVDEWLKHRNGTKAYKIAYPFVKNTKTAEAGASRLLSNDKVKVYINKRLAKMSDKAEITQERILREESRLAFSDIAEIFKGETLVAPDKLPEDVRRAIAGVKVKVKSYGGTGDSKRTETTYEYKFWDKGRALERVEKHLGMFEKDNLQKGATLEEIIKRLDGEE